MSAKPLVKDKDTGKVYRLVKHYCQPLPHWEAKARNGKGMSIFITDQTLGECFEPVRR